MTTKTLPVLSFAKLEQGMPMPHLLDIQTRAFASLLQPDGKGAERTDVGLERVFKDVFPIQDVNGNYSLEFVKYGLGEPKYSVEECIERDMTYSVPLKATLQLVVMEEVGETVKTKRPKNIIEKEVYLGELPILTPLGTFVINGAERVIVSQLHRDRKSTRLNSSHRQISYAVFCLKKKKKETDPASRERRKRVEQEIANLSEQLRAMKLALEQERQPVEEIQRLKKELEQAQVALEKAEREYNYEEMARLRYGTIPKLEERIHEMESKLSNIQGTRLLKEEVDAEDIAEIVSRWTHIPVSRLMEAEIQKLLTMEDRLRERAVGP